MNMSWVGMSGIVLGCAIGCGSTSGGENEEMAGAAGAPAASGGTKASSGAATSGGAGGGGAGPAAAGTSMGGEAAGGSALAGAAGTSGAAGKEGIAGTTGAGGGGGGAACNTLELVVEQPTCSTLASLPASEGGTILEGTYAMVRYEMPFCIALEQTLLIEEVSAGTFRMDTTVSIGSARATATMVKQGNTLRSTSTCGSSEVDQIYGYTAYRDGERDFLRIVRDSEGLFIYRRLE